MSSRKIASKQITIFWIKATCFAACSSKGTTKTEQALVKIFALLKTITALTKAATDPRKDDQLAENLGKSLGKARIAGQRFLHF